MGNKSKSSPVGLGNESFKELVILRPVQPVIDLYSKSPNLDFTVVEDNSTLDLDLCTSAKNIRTANWSGAGGSDLTTQDGFILIDSAVLFEFLSSNVRCGECDHYSVTTAFKNSSKYGFCHDIELKYQNCSVWSTGFKTNRASSKSGHSEINPRMVTYVRSLGRGFSALQHFSLYVNSTPAMT